MAKKSQLAQTFDVNFFAYLVLMFAAGAACFWVAGSKAFWSTFASDLDLFLLVLPRFLAAIMLAAFVQALLPRDKIARYLSDTAGFGALTIAALVGSATPGGPMTSFPLVQALERAGTGRSVLITYLTSWSTNGVQRIINWELAFLGFEFAALRYACAFPCAFIAGFTSRFLPPAKRRKPTPASEDGQS